MKNPTILLIQHLIIELKSGKSTQLALSSFKKRKASHWQKLHLSNAKQKAVPVTSIEYELQIIINRGLKGLPILKSLEAINKKAMHKMLVSIETHAAQAPFLALIPLFLFQMPSLALIFFYPIINKFLSEAI